MTLVNESTGFRITVEAEGMERREHRRHDLEQQSIMVQRWDGARRIGRAFGTIVDLSAGGVRIRTSQRDIRPDNQIRVRLELPSYAGICPFIEHTAAGGVAPKRDWVGWMTVSRVEQTAD